MSLFRKEPLRRTRQGNYVLTLGTEERAILRVLPSQMRQLLDDPEDPGLRRLFPPAYAAADDKEHEEEYQRFMHDDLLNSHTEALAVLEATADAAELTAEQLDGWARAINSIRLLLGTRLDVSEEDDPNEAVRDPEYALYYFLGYLQESAVDALSWQD